MKKSIFILLSAFTIFTAACNGVNEVYPSIDLSQYQSVDMMYWHDSIQGPLTAECYINYGTDQPIIHPNSAVIAYYEELLHWNFHYILYVPDSLYTKYIK